MKKLLFLSFFITSLVANAQLSRYRAAERQYNDLSYLDASKNLKAFLENGEVPSGYELKALRLLGLCYKNLEDTQDAEQVYERIINKFPNELEPTDYLYYAQILAQNGKLKESQKMYSLYGQEQSEDLRGRKFTVAYMDPSVFYKDSAAYQVNYLYPINSKQADFSPMFYEDGIVFVSARDEGGIIKRVFNQNDTPFLDLFLFPDTAYLANKNKEVLEVASLSGGNDQDDSFEEQNSGLIQGSQEDIEEFSKKINSKYHEGPVTFFRDYNRVIFTRNNFKTRRGKGSDGITKLKLYMATKENNKWRDINELPFNSDDFSCGHPALNPENDILYFASDKPGGYGGTDLYKVSYKNGIWGEPENLGPEINTVGNELFPYMDDAGNLYFSSNGHAGLGGLDIFYVNFQNNLPIGKVENIGAPFNSPKDDFGIISNPDRTAGYFSSNRKRGQADDNIYSFFKTCRQLKVLVYDAETKKALPEADLRVLKNGQGQNLLYTDNNGAVQICLENQSSFEFKAYKEGYLASGFNLSTILNSHDTRSEVIIYLEQSKSPIIEGKVFVQQNKQAISGAIVKFKNLDTGQEEQYITSNDGKYRFQPKDKGRYEIVVTSQGFATNTINLGKIRSSWKNNTTYEQDIAMIAKGNIIKIENIYYDFDKYNLRKDAKKQLDDQVLEIMHKYPSMVIELRSHTDCRGTNSYNLELSEKRAQEVVKYLKAKGISSSRLVAKGYGETEPVNKCNCENNFKCSEAEYQQNRRTEFKVLNID